MILMILKMIGCLALLMFGTPPFAISYPNILAQSSGANLER